VGEEPVDQDGHWKWAVLVFEPKLRMGGRQGVHSDPQGRLEDCQGPELRVLVKLVWLRRVPRHYGARS